MENTSSQKNNQIQNQIPATNSPSINVNQKNELESLNSINPAKVEVNNPAPTLTSPNAPIIVNQTQTQTQPTTNPQMQTVNQNISTNTVKTDFYSNLNKIPTDPNLDLLSQSTPFTPISRRNNNAAPIVEPLKPTPAETAFLSAGNTPVIRPNIIQNNNIIPSVSNIYTNLQSEAEKAEAIALRGNQVNGFFIHDDAKEKENIFADVAVIIFEIYGIIVLLLPVFGLSANITKMLFLPSVIFLIIGMLLTVAFKVNNLITSLLLIILTLQFIIALFVLMRALGYISGDIILIGSYLSSFYL